MGVNFSPEQLQAIETLDKSILVSAAAGSGKTAVLVERIIRIILDGKANVDEMLVVTFTKAAASEMRLRLSKAIRQKMRENPEDADRMRDQLNRLYKAYITTIDSFALRVIREFFYETDIEPDFGACDEVQGEIMRRDALNELFEDGFADDNFLSATMTGDEAEHYGIDFGFREFLRLYSEERSEDGFKDKMLKAYAGLRSMPRYFEWAYVAAEQLKTTPENFEGSILHETMRDDAIETLAGGYDAACRVRKLLYDNDLGDMYEEKLAPEVEAVIALHEMVSSGTFDFGVIAGMDNIPSIRLVAKKDQKAAYEPIKTEVKSLRDIYKKGLQNFCKRYAAPDIETRLAEMNEAYKYTIYYLKLLEEFERRYAAKKNDQRVMDFADMEHNAVRILDNEEAAATLRKRFKFVFVDEYQDTNKIQEYLIGKVSRPDNVFKVGDLKQSIYKFRQAEPELFESLYNEYSKEEVKDGIAIDLSRNFRTNDATIRYINAVFEKVMKGYDDRAKLYTGVTDIPKEYDFIPDVHVLYDVDSDGESGWDSSDETYTKLHEGLTGPEIDEEIEDLTKEEAEAAYIADLAANIIGTEFKDSKAGVVRKAEAKDIAILFRAVKTRGSVMSRALRARGVESHVEESDDYFDTVEIGVALSLLTCIDNMKRDVPLIASLHSEAFNWTPEELAEVRIAHNGYVRELRQKQEDADDSQDASPSLSKHRAAYWEALAWYCEDGPEEPLKNKAAKAVETILSWRKLARMMPLEDFVWKVLTDSGYYMMAGAMNGGARRQANLRTLADRAGKFSRDKVASLSSFINFLDVLRSKKVNNGQAPMAGSDDDVVRICTIHKSKGLEYPFVIVGGLGHDFRYDNSDKGFTFDSSVGVSLSYIDPKRRFWRSTLMQRAIVAKSKRDSYQEELRILYVAMTRARNKLILVGTTKNPDKLGQFKPNPKNFLEVLQDVMHTPYNRYYINPLGKVDSSAPKTGAPSILDSIPESMSANAAELYRTIDDRFAYEYPDAELLTAKAKYSVSEIRRDAVSEASSDVSSDERKHAVTVSRKPRGVSAAEVGTAYHRIMEFVDFGRAIEWNESGETGAVDREYIDERIEVLRQNGAFEDEVARLIEGVKIYEFFESDLGRRAARAAKARRLKKEKPFTMRTMKDGRNVLVQGVIDCCFEENGKMVLIDYKTSFINPGKRYEDEVERIRREYKVQIELYSKAVLKGTGMEVGEAYLYLFSSGEAVGF